MTSDIEEHEAGVEAMYARVREREAIIEGQLSARSSGPLGRGREYTFTVGGNRLYMPFGALRDSDPDALRRTVDEAQRLFASGKREVWVKQNWGGPPELGCVSVVRPRAE